MEVWWKKEGVELIYCGVTQAHHHPNSWKHLFKPVRLRSPLLFGDSAHARIAAGRSAMACRRDPCSRICREGGASIVGVSLAAAVLKCGPPQTARFELFFDLGFVGM